MTKHEHRCERKIQYLGQEAKQSQTRLVHLDHAVEDLFVYFVLFDSLCHDRAFTQALINEFVTALV